MGEVGERGGKATRLIEDLLLVGPDRLIIKKIMCAFFACCQYCNEKDVKIKEADVTVTRSSRSTVAWPQLNSQLCHELCSTPLP